MSVVKVIVPEGYTGAGEVRSIPQEEAAAFAEMGWERADKRGNDESETKPSKGTAKNK